MVRASKSDKQSAAPATAPVENVVEAAARRRWIHSEGLKTPGSETLSSNR
jgi:hypothetical protein